MYKTQKLKEKIVTERNNKEIYEDLKNILSDESFDDLMNQSKASKTQEENSSLYQIIKNIKNIKCSENYICIEIGAIVGFFKSMNPYTTPKPETVEKEYHTIVKPVIIMNNTVIEEKPKIIAMEDDCDNLITSLDGVIENSKKVNRVKIPRFKQTKGIVDDIYSSINENQSKNDKIFASEKNKCSNDQEEFESEGLQMKFYRKVSIGNKFIYSTHLFKEGINIIVVNRDAKYSKVMEQTFNTNDLQKESDKLADTIRDTPCDKIIILTGIGKWLGAMNPKLIKEIKQIGGPDFADMINYFTSKSLDISSYNKPFIVIGRKGLCKYNGVWKVEGFDSFILKNNESCEENNSSIELIRNPNECYFENIKIEQISIKNEIISYAKINKTASKKDKFFMFPLMKMSLNLCKDSRFNYLSPTVASVTPNSGSVHGGQEIKIKGFNFGFHTVELLSVMVKGIYCGDVLVLSPNLISCITRPSTIIGPGPGSVAILMKNGLSTPGKACLNYNYIGDRKEAIDDLKNTMNQMNAMYKKGLPIFLNTKHLDNKIDVFDHLLLDNMKINSYSSNEDNKTFRSRTTYVGKLNGLVNQSFNKLTGVVLGNNSNILLKRRGNRFGNLSS